ncbi:MAG: RluA family pseudouridine synthase [Desulfobacteraceae bacterium]|nr:RluA family pseudouridine synthase [Desulfobacteraceae bacterium]MCB9494319.1 RluA family pseudouridine synthase [Desulfobacteraceae bacterium]
MVNIDTGALSGREFELIVSEKDSKKRLDVFLSAHLDCSRNFASNLVLEKNIIVNNKDVKPSYKVKSEDKVCGRIPEVRPIYAEPEKISLNIIFEDEHIAVINKPPGMVVHPSPGHSGNTLVNALLYHFENVDFPKDSLRPGIVHRLDKDTSGAIVIAKNPRALERLGQSFKERTVNKKYLAFVHGVPAAKGIIEKPVGRHLTERKKMSVNSKNGRYALTYFNLVRSFEDISLVEADIKTGRTHQIRVHFSSEGFPLIGDEIYGFKHPMKHLGDKTRVVVKKYVKRQMLHSAYISFLHPITGEALEFEAPFFDDMKSMLYELERLQEVF